MIKSADIHGVLSRLKGYGGTYVKEFTWWVALDTAKQLKLEEKRRPADDRIALRIDGLLIDTTTRETHGFEIKVDVWDWHRDKKWQLYRDFCSTLSVACPEGMIDETEVPPGYGLLWIDKLGRERWVRRPTKIPHEPYNWKDKYLKILENEFPRMQAEIRALRAKKYAAKPALP